MSQIPQLLPDLAPWEYEALKASIRRFGVILPVVRDEFGNTIDGHQRERACQELGIEDYPAWTFSGLTEDEKRDRSLILNQARRRLNRRQMRELIAAELKRTPEMSSNWLAQVLGTTDKTVEAVRQRLIATSEIPKLGQLRVTVRPNHPWRAWYPVPRTASDAVPGESSMTGTRSHTDHRSRLDWWRGQIQRLCSTS